MKILKGFLFKKCAQVLVAPGAPLRQGEVGQSIIEMAFVLPLLLLLLLGTIELGRMAYFSIEVRNAALAGAEYGMQSTVNASNAAGIQTAAVNDGPNVPGLSATPAPTHSCVCSTGSTAPNCALSDCTGSRLIEYVQVNTTATVTTLFHYPGVPSSFVLNGKAVMRVEQ
jgi:Flp pilus assembly protein TadG